MANSAGNTHSSERICARGGAPGGAAHGQILALFAVAAAFRATRWRHNLDRGKDRSPRGATALGPAQVGQDAGFPLPGFQESPSCARSSQVTKGLRVALRGSESKEESYL